jgi:hypothetical protein
MFAHRWGQGNQLACASQKFWRETGYSASPCTESRYEAGLRNESNVYCCGLEIISGSTVSGAAGATVAEFDWEKAIGEKPCELAPT